MHQNKKFRRANATVRQANEPYRAIIESCMQRIIAVSRPRSPYSYYIPRRGRIRLMAARTQTARCKDCGAGLAFLLFSIRYNNNTVTTTIALVFGSSWSQVHRETPPCGSAGRSLGNTPSAQARQGLLLHLESSMLAQACKSAPC